MINPDSYTLDMFEELPLVVEGESKIVRDLGSGLCLIKYKPTIYSFTNNHCGVVEGSDILRMKASKVFLDVLRNEGIDHAYITVGEQFILAKLIEEPPPIEVVIKRFHTGTSKHRYYGMGDQFPIRKDHPYFSNKKFGGNEAYPLPIVRFDWRNPVWHPEKVEAMRKEHPELGQEVHTWPKDIRAEVMIADEVMCDAQADWFINVKNARQTAIDTYQALSDFLGERDVILCDICLFISADGKTVFGEISQDCGRFRHFEMGSLDKDVWRTGGSSERVLEKWQILLDVIK